MPPTIHDASVPGSVNVWRLTGTVGATSVDVRFTVPDAYGWEYHTDATKMADPCGAPPTLLVQTGGALGKPTIRPTMRLEGSAANAAVADLLAAWAAIGPFTLYTPTDTGGRSVLCDPSQGNFLPLNRGSHWEGAMGFQAV